MEITRETVNEWLEDKRRDREWLAEMCKIGTAAVGHWLNKKGEARPIPAEHQITIRALMEQDAAEDAAKQAPLPIPQNLVLYPTKLQFDDWNRAYKHSDADTLEQWAAEGLDTMAKDWIYHNNQKVADGLEKAGGTRKKTNRERRSVGKYDF